MQYLTPTSSPRAQSGKCLRVVKSRHINSVSLYRIWFLSSSVVTEKGSRCAGRAHWLNVKWADSGCQLGSPFGGLPSLHDFQILMGKGGGGLLFSFRNWVFRKIQNKDDALFRRTQRNYLYLKFFYFFIKGAILKLYNQLMFDCNSEVLLYIHQR